MGHKIKTILVDDEDIQLISLKEDLQSYSNIEVVETSFCGQDAIEKINRHQPDLVFLDIELPDMKGYEILQHLEVKPIIIYRTGFPNYAANTFQQPLPPNNFLVKPVSDEVLAEAIKKAMSDLENSLQLERLTAQNQAMGLLELSWSHGDREKKTLWVSPDDIIFLQKVKGDDYLMVYLSKKYDDRPELKITISKAVEKWADYGFYQCNRGEAVNFKHVKKFNKSKGEVLLNNDEIISVPLGKRKNFEKALKNFKQSL